MTELKANNIEKEVLKLFEKHFDNYIKALSNPINDLFIAGSVATLKELNKDRKPIGPTKQETALLNAYAKTNINKLKSDMERAVTNQVTLGLLERETNKEIKQRIDKVLKGDNPTRFKYETRLELIRRDVSNRVFNYSSFKTAKQVGAKFKYLVGKDDHRQGADSKIAIKKYGTPDKAIPIEDDFIVVEGKHKYVYKFSPNRPNDRETTIYITEKPKKDKSK